MDEETRAEIAALVAAEDEAWNRGSAEGLAERVLPEVVFTNVVGTLSVVTGALHAPPGIQLIDGAINARREQVLVRRTDGGWVASFHNVAVNPAAGGPPPKPNP